MLKKQGVGILCSFLLFVLMFTIYRFGLAYEHSSQGHLNPGLLLFIVPGMIASLLSPHGRVTKPVFGALLAVPVCLIMISLWCAASHSVWQDLALLFGAVFWCALGALCGLFILARLKRRRVTHIWL